MLLTSHLSTVFENLEENIGVERENCQVDDPVKDERARPVPAIVSKSIIFHRLMQTICHGLNLTLDEEAFFTTKCCTYFASNIANSLGFGRQSTSLKVCLVTAL
jgi:hypothetical protein